MKKLLVLAAIIGGGAMASMPNSAEAGRVRVRTGWGGPRVSYNYGGYGGYRPYRSNYYYRSGYGGGYYAPGWNGYYGGRRGVWVGSPNFGIRYRW